MSKVTRVNPDELLKWPGLAQVSVSNARRMVFVAGQTATDKDFQTIGLGDLRAQTICAYRHLRIALESVGASVEDLLSSTVYIVGLNEDRTAIFASAIEDVFDGDPLPPHSMTLIGVSSLSGSEVLIEISATAAL